MTAPVAPAPAPSATPAPAAPTPSLSAALAHVRSGGTPETAPTAAPLTGAVLTGASAPPEAIDPPATHHSATQARDAQGQFTGTPAEGENGETVAEGADGAAPDGEAGDDAFIPFTLPGETARGEEDIVIEFPNDPVVQERLARLANSGMRRKEYEEAMGAVQQQAQQAEQVITTATLDPAGFANEYFPAEAKAALVMLWLSDPAFLDTVRDDVAVLDDETQRRRVAAEARLSLDDTRKTVANTLQERQQNRAITQTVTTALTALVPDSLPPTAREDWIASRHRELAAMLQQGLVTKQQLANPLSLPAVLGPTLQAWGVANPVQRIAAALDQQSAGPGSVAATRAPAAPVTVPRTGPAPAASAAHGTPATRTSPSIAQVTQAQQARQAAAQTGGPGVGAPLASPERVAPGANSLGRTIDAMRDRLRAPAPA